jgi:nucleotide exchange factor SIL1
VRLNLATGKREAKLLSEDDAAKEPATGEPVGADRGAEVSPEAAGGESITVVTDVTGEINDATVKASHTVASHALAVVEEATEDKETASESATDSSETASDVDEAPPAREPNWNHEKIYEVLQALPEPPDVDGMDIHEARAKLSTPEFRRRMIKLWKKRQEELKEALGSLQDDAKYLGGLLEDFREADQNGDTAGQLRVLEVLEWEVQDLDKTHVFNFIGGFGIMTEYLNATNLPVRASASWLIGTAVKNYKDGQDWAINAGAIPRLVDSMTLAVPEDDAEKASTVFEVKKKAVYGLSSLVRSNPRGQRLLLSLDGPAKLSQLMDARHPLGVQLKAVLFVHDLLHEASVGTSVDGDEAALPKLHKAFRSPVWCAHSAQFVKDYVRCTGHG